MADEPESQSAPLVVAWQEWRAPLARVRTQGTVGAFDDSSSPPSGNLQDESMASLVVVAWQDSRAPLARVRQQVSLGAFDESAGGQQQPEPSTAHWQPPRVPRRPWTRVRGLVQTEPWDGDGPSPVVPVEDGPGADFRVIAWQDWQAPRARRAGAFTDAPQDLDGFAPSATPDQSLVVMPWFTGRVPREQINNLALLSASLLPDPPPEPETGQSFIAGLGFAGRGYRDSRFNPRARVMAVQATSAQDVSFSPGGTNQTQIFHHHHSQG